VELPDTHDVEVQKNNLVNVILNTAITSQQSLDVAAVILQQARDMKDEIEATFGEVRQAAHGTHKAVMAAQKKHLDPLLDAEKMLREKIWAFLDANPGAEAPGVSMIDSWDYEVVDEAKVPRLYMTVDTTKVMKIVNSLGKDTNIAGIKVKQKGTLMVRKA
jgi:mannitol-specific phosphotransferase system IIBC component